MLNLKKNKLIISFIILVFLLNSSCRSSIKEPLNQPTLNRYEQIDTLSRGDPDQRGIITYDTYQILIANGKETIAQIGLRLDINGDKLALYNGLISNYRPRLNEIIAIPETRFISSSGWTTEITQKTITNNNSTPKKISPANNPLRHRVKKGETIYSVAREYNVSVNSLATWNGLGPDLDIKMGREIIIPAAAASLNKISSKKRMSTSEEATLVEVDQVAETTQEHSQKTNSISKVKDPPAIRDKKSQNNILPQPKVISVRPFISPVKGEIISQYSQKKGSNNNNGVDYTTIALQTVKAVSNGTIVLISDIVGGNGKIILIRHQGELITIYGRLTNISVKKGQVVSQGDKIGEVILDTKTNAGLMHFEVRKGMQSIDPETMIR